MSDNINQGNKCYAEGDTEVEVPPQTAHDLLLRGIRNRPSHTYHGSQHSGDRATRRNRRERFPHFFHESAIIRLTREEQLPTAVNEFIAVLREEAREFCKR